MAVGAVELALGTVQFGMTYGVAGRGAPVPAAEVRSILGVAWRGGVRMLDTASAYGDIEQRLSDLGGGYDFEIVSKIPAIEDATSHDQVAAFVAQSVVRSKERLGERLRAVLFHRASDLTGAFGATAWQSAVEATRSTSLRLGASCYSPQEALSLNATIPLQVVQLPGNAIDQRLRQCASPLPFEVHLRSVFLQGLMLLPAHEAAARVPKSAEAMQRWATWCDQQGMTPLQAALAIAKGLPGVRYCVVGVDSVAQLEQILQAWNSSTALRAPELSAEDANVIDPRQW